MRKDFILPLGHKNVISLLKMLAIGLGPFWIVFLIEMSTDVAWSQEGEPQRGVNIKHEVGFRAEKGHTEYHLLDTWEKLKIPIEISDLGNKLIFTNHSDEKIELTFKFMGPSYRNLDGFFKFSQKTISLDPGQGLPRNPGSPAETLQVIPILEKIRKEKKLESIEFQVYIRNSIAKIPVTFVGLEKGPPPETPTPEVTKEEEEVSLKPSLRVEGKFIPLDEKPTLKIKDTATYLVFKYEGEKKTELRASIVKAGEKFEKDLELKPGNITLSKRKSLDSLKLTLLSDIFFKQPPKDVGLVILATEGKEFTIPITFERMRKPGWNSNYVKFQYENQDIREVLTLPFRPEKWKEIQIKNNSGQDISVFYQVVLDSQGVIILDGGEVEVKNNARQSIPWQRKIAGITSGTFKFEVWPADTSLKGFETAYVIKVSGPIYWEIGQFFKRSWLIILLFLVLGGFGYLLYFQTARIHHLKQQLSGGDSKATKREEEIYKLKHEVAQLKMDKTHLEDYITQVTKKQGAVPQRGTPAVETPFRISQDEYEDARKRLRELESDLMQRDSDLDQKIKELDKKGLEFDELKQKYLASLRERSELTELITALKSELKQKGEAISGYTQENSILKRDKASLERNLNTLVKNVSDFKESEYPIAMHKFLLDMIDFRTQPNETTTGVNRILALYKEFESMKDQLPFDPIAAKSEAPFKTTYRIDNVLDEVRDVSNFINKELNLFFSSKDFFKFAQISPQSEKTEDVKDKYVKETQRHLEEFISKIKILNEMITSQRDLGKNMENIRKHLLEEVANHVFITWAELEQPESGASPEIKSKLRRIKESLFQIIQDHFRLMPMEIRIGQDYNSQDFEIVGRVKEGEGFDGFNSNSIVSIASWGYYVAGTQKPSSLAKVQVKI